MNKLVEKIYAAYNFQLKPIEETTSISSLITKVVDVLGLVAGSVAVIYLIWSGIKYITASGNPEQAKQAQTGIINAVIGIVVVVLAYTIFRSVANFSSSTNFFR